MNIRTIQLSSLCTAVAMFATGCAEMSPGGNAALLGGLSGAAAGGIARASGMSTGASIATGIATGAVVAAVTYIIAKHQATERQRQVAQARARASYARMSAERKSALKSKKVRYIAVDTEKNEKTSPQAKRTVMIWDTQSQEVVGNNVYDVQSPPSVGQTAKFDTYSAEYVGSGS
jgi:predicted lipid-binding transport protein (Tim44 family)